MKLGILFVVASLMIVGAVVVVAIPIQVEAAGSQFCTTGVGCFKGKGECKKASEGIAGDICRRGH
ncbi:MAG TPA: hypothetical protein VFB48_05610 [Nitrososphaeraceae archaeon]|nr:hypothetical protein [Nitrososphaeraceae archaeon]